MRKTFSHLLLSAAMICGGMTVTSCEELLEALAAMDDPVENQQPAPDPEPEPEPKQEGSISYATASVSKTFGDADFINELTNTGDGAVAYASSDPTVATVDPATGLVTIVGNGSTTITATVTDSETFTYATKEATYTLGVGTATMTVTAMGYSGTYDGEAHGITVTIAAPEGATVMYGTAAGSYTLTDSPAYTNAGTYTVYYQVTKTNYTTVTGSATVEIAKKAATISFAESSVSKTFGDGAFTNTLSNSGDGAVTYESSNTAVAEVNAVNGEVTIKTSGDATIKATVTDGTNYTYATKTVTYTLGVSTATMTVSATGYTGTYDGSAHGITVTAPSGATVKYGTTEGTYNLTDNPTYTDAGTYTVYFEVTKDGFTTVKNSATVTISKADMSVTATGYSGTYDTAAHGITLTVTAPSGATVKYGTTEGTYNLTDNPTYTDAGIYTVYYEVTKDNYNTVSGSATVTINKAAGTISFPSDTSEHVNDDNAFDHLATLTGDGTITGYSSSASGVATVDKNGRVTIVSTGTTIITVTVADGTNYKYTPNYATYTVIVKPGGLKGPSVYGKGSDPF